MNKTIPNTTFIRIISLSIAVARAELKQKFESGIPSICWYLISPLFTFFLLFFGFKDSLGRLIPFFPVYLGLGIALFNFFQQVTIETTQILFENRFTIKSLAFPTEALLIGAVIKALICHLGELFLLALLLSSSHISFFHLVFYPVILLIVAFSTVGIGFLLSILSIYAVDLPSLWLFMVRILWLVTPIFYVFNTRMNFLYRFNSINPLYYLLVSARLLIISGEWTLVTTGSVGMAFVLFIVGWFVFQRKKYLIPEKI